MKGRYVKKICFMLLCSVFILTPFLLVAGGEPEKEEVLPEEVTIEFWNGIGPPENVVLTDMINEFNRTNQDGITVKEVIMDWGTLYSKLLLNFKVGTAPDVTTMHQTSIKEQVDLGVLAEIGALAKKAGFKKGDFVESAWNGTLLEGKRYAIPLDMHPMALFYNAKLFKEAGLDPNKPPKNFDEFISYTQKLTKDTDGDGKIDQYGFGLDYSGGGVFRFWMSLVWQQGGTILTSDLKKANFDNEKGVSALQLMHDFVYKYKVTPEREESSSQDFRKGIVAMEMNGPWHIFDCNDTEGLDYKTTPVPTFYEQPAIWGNSHVLSMPDTGDKAKMEASIKLIKYLSDNTLEWTVRAGHLPVRKEILMSSEFKKLEPSKAFAASLDFAHYYPLISKSSEVFGRESTSPFIIMVESVMLNKETPENAVQKAAKTVNKILSE